MNRSVWFPGDLAERVQAEAARQDRSFNWLVVRALESALRSESTAEPASQGRAPRTETVVPSASSRAPRSVGTDNPASRAVEGAGRRLEAGLAQPLPPGVVKASSLRKRALLDVVAFGPPAISAARARVRLQEGRVFVAGVVEKDGTRMVDPSEVQQRDHLAGGS